MGYYTFGDFWVRQKKITIYSRFGSPCNNSNKTMIILRIVIITIWVTINNDNDNNNQERGVLFKRKFVNILREILLQWKFTAFFNLILASLHCDTGEVFDEKKATDTSNFAVVIILWRMRKNPGDSVTHVGKTELKQWAFPYLLNCFWKDWLNFS